MLELRLLSTKTTVELVIPIEIERDLLLPDPVCVLIARLSMLPQRVKHGVFTYV